jgi:hypothetical protein
MRDTIVRMIGTKANINEMMINPIEKGTMALLDSEN